MIYLENFCWGCDMRKSDLRECPSCGHWLCPECSVDNFTCELCGEICCADCREQLVTSYDEAGDPDEFQEVCFACRMSQPEK